MQNQVRIIVTHEEEMFVAQCLEHDVAVQAPDMETLQRRLAATLAMEANSGNLDAIPAAPEALQELWIGASEIEAHIENTEMRLAA